MGTRGLFDPLGHDGDYQTLNWPVGGNLGAVLSARAARAGCAACGSRDRLVHDPADGARASSALGAAAEAAVDLTGGARRSRRAQRCPHVMVGQHIAGAHDHGSRRSQRV